MQKGLDAIAHPGRRAMIGLLLTGERPAGELADGARMSQPMASQHLRVLREAGLVRVAATAIAASTPSTSKLSPSCVRISMRLGTDLSALRQAVERAASSAPRAGS